MGKPNPKTKKIIVDMQPVGRRAQIESGATLLEAAQSSGVSVVSICGGMGTCEGCRVRLIEGRLSPLSASEEDLLSRDDLAAGYRLACQAVPLSDVKLDIPPESLTSTQRLQIEGVEIEITPAPCVIAVDLDLPKPTLQDLRSDMDRIEASLAKNGIETPKIGRALLAELSNDLRKLDWNARLALRGSEVVSVMPPGSPLFGVAIDIGTTKLAAYLVDLAEGRVVSKGGAMNPQIAYGEDVISRIAYADANQDGRGTLQSSVVARLNELIHQLEEDAGVSRNQVVEAVVAGNTAMHHLLAGLPVRQLGRAPYVAALSQTYEFPASSIGLDLSAGGYVLLPPVIAGFVGADHVTMLLATEVWQAAKPTLAIDIGTNTELTLAYNGRLLSCSCASGPAFEGAHIVDGMRAAPGAIERVQIIDGEVHIYTIEDHPPVGICGSGILDAVAELLRSKSLERSGAMIPGPGYLPSRNGKHLFLLSPSKESGHGRDIVVTRQDINEIQLAKSAIRTAIEILLAEVGIEAEALDRIIIAGAFGTYIDVGSAIRVGMFPDLPEERFVQVGNAAGMGAQRMLVSSSQRDLAAKIAHKAEYIELTTHPDFSERFIEEMYF